MHSARALARRNAAAHVRPRSLSISVSAGAGSLMKPQLLGGVRTIQYKRARPKRDANKVRVNTHATLGMECLIDRSVDRWIGRSHADNRHLQGPTHFL